MKIRIPNRIIDWLIAKAKKTPYFHLPGYMNRWWLVPYKAQGDHQYKGNIAPVVFWRRPIAWTLQRFDVAVRVHEILSSDAGRDYHDHPWPYITIVLRGGYFEETPVFKDGIFSGASVKWHPPGSVLFRRAQSWHRLELPRGGHDMKRRACTTLFISFKYRQHWGFLTTPAHKTYYRDYFEARDNK